MLLCELVLIQILRISMQRDELDAASRDCAEDPFSLSPASECGSPFGNALSEADDAELHDTFSLSPGNQSLELDEFDITVDSPDLLRSRDNRNSEEPPIVPCQPLVSFVNEEIIRTVAHQLVDNDGSVPKHPGCHHKVKTAPAVIRAAFSDGRHGSIMEKALFFFSCWMHKPKAGNRLWIVSSTRARSTLICFYSTSGTKLPTN